MVTTAFFLAIIIGTVLGIIAAQKPKSFVNHVVTVLSLSGFSAPIFWTGLMLLIAFAYLLPIFPAFGMSTPGFQGTALEVMFDVLKHLVLPAVTLASVYIAVYSRLARASMLDVLGSDYIRTARSKGLPEHIVNYRHVARIALIPILTLIGFSLSGLLGGAFIVELIFGIPGVGRFALDALFARDFPVIMAIALIGAASLVIANLIVDILYSVVDPRIRYQ